MGAAGAERYDVLGRGEPCVLHALADLLQIFMRQFCLSEVLQVLEPFNHVLSVHRSAAVTALRLEQDGLELAIDSLVAQQVRKPDSFVRS